MKYELIFAQPLKLHLGELLLSTHSIHSWIQTLSSALLPRQITPVQ